jgi:hypothetical protein
MTKWNGLAVAASLALAWADPAGAQGASLADSKSPFGEATLSDAEREKVVLPKLVFAATAADENDYDKYFVFHRTATDFATAYADVAECDGYARGLRSSIAYQTTYYPYAGTIGGAVGNVLGNLMVAAIFGSAEKRRLRRVNMRTCMHFKGYARYGLPKDVWKEFHFEEGFSAEEETKRRGMLAQQALVASTWSPQGKELGL